MTHARTHASWPVERRDPIQRHQKPLQKHWTTMSAVMAVAAVSSYVLSGVLGQMGCYSPCVCNQNTQLPHPRVDWKQLEKVWYLLAESPPPLFSWQNAVCQGIIPSGGSVNHFLMFKADDIEIIVNQNITIYSTDNITWQMFHHPIFSGESRFGYYSYVREFKDDLLLLHRCMAMLPRNKNTWIGVYGKNMTAQKGDEKWKALFGKYMDSNKFTVRFYDNKRCSEEKVKELIPDGGI